MRQKIQGETRFVCDHIVKDTEAKRHYSDIGGIFFGRYIKSVKLQNYLAGIIVSTGKPFLIESSCFSGEALAVFIAPGSKFKIRTDREDYTMFVHFDHFLIEPGLQPAEGISELSGDVFAPLQMHFFNGISGAQKKEDETEALIRNMVLLLPADLVSRKNTDSRVLECIRLLNEDEYGDYSLKTLAGKVSLSQDRLSHLFKEETGMTMKKYIQRCKMKKSMRGLHQKMNFTDAAHYGGFSDQPHFIKIFRKMFGILPKKIRS